MRHHIIAVSFACLMAAAIAAGATEEVWIPAAASNPGLQGTSWTTDLWLQSRVIGAPMEITAAFFAYRAGTPSPSETTIVLQPGEHRQIADAVATLFGEDRPGAIRLRSDDPFFAQSRTANDGGDAGSFGQGIPVESSPLVEGLQQQADHLGFREAGLLEGLRRRGDEPILPLQRSSGKASASPVELLPESLQGCGSRSWLRRRPRNSPVDARPTRSWLAFLIPAVPVEATCRAALRDTRR